jgi:NADPH:quinone reductase-like Zn-dependent oxidoreductase
MSRAVRFDRYGGVDVLEVREVEAPEPGRGEVLVRVRAAGINPGEATIRSGALDARWPATFPSGQGSDLAGVVDAIGPGVEGVAVGDEVIGFTHRRASQAELVVVGAGDLTPRPAGVPWDQAGALFVAGTTAWAAVRAVAPRAGETVVVSGAAGGVGSIVVQLARATGARVIGLAGPPNHAWLVAHGVTPLDYRPAEDLADRIKVVADPRVDAFVDTHGDGYVGLAVGLGVDPDRIDTIIDWETAAEVGARTDGNMVGARAEVLAELAASIAAGDLEVPIARAYPLAEVQDAFRELEQRHTRGKIVLIP